jgi:hypothetical protein
VKKASSDYTEPIPALTLEAQIKRDFRRHLKALGFQKDQQGFLQPPEITKECFRALHQAQRNECLTKEAGFIARSWPALRHHFANGHEVKPEHITPRLELIQADTWQSDLFRLASLTWTVPVSQGYGRRMRFLVWDDSNGKLIGIFSLGDPVFNLRVRDNWIGWTLEQREERLVNLMDAYVLGSVPPYNFILGGKLVASLIRTAEVKDAFAERYRETRGIISKEKKFAALCIVTTTSALGRSSIYNRLTLSGYKLFLPIGYTSGWGHFHIPDLLFAKMRRYLEIVGDAYANNHGYGEGPNWKLRAVRKVLRMVGVDPDLMRHGISREVFICPIASNARAFLTGKSREPCFNDLEGVEMVSRLALDRWVIPRAERQPEFRAWQHDDLYVLFCPSGTSTHRNQELTSISPRI